MKLFIAEKPSLAQAIAAGIGVGKKLNGYISLNGGKEIVTWCYGHILAQLNPDEHAEKYRAWRVEDLPIIPSVWKLKIKAEAAIKIAEAGRKPTIDASISKSAESDRIFKSDRSRNWQAGLTLQWNIFDNGVTSAGVNEMRAWLKKTQSIATQIADSIRLEVHNAYIDLRTAEENISTTQIAVTRAEEDYHLAQIRYVEGVGTNLEVIDAQEKLTQARTNYFSALYAYNVSKAALEKAMGVPIDINVPDYISERR